MVRSMAPRTWLIPCLISTVVASKQRPASGQGNSELVCHNDDPADCYPKVFLATNEFRIVHPDQDLPVGLHVRLNIQTGEREAKLADPSEQLPSVADLPVDKAVVVVDSPRDQTLPSGAPVYDNAGRIREPTGSDLHKFRECASAVVKTAPGPAFDKALECLEELSHDIFFGARVADDVELLTVLFCTMSTRDVFSLSSQVSAVPRARRAAAAVAAAFQNNPVAIRAVERRWDVITEASCQNDSRDDRDSLVGSLVFTTIMPDRTAVSPYGRDPGPELVNAKLAAIKGILRSPKIRQYFLGRDGMRQVSRVLMVENSTYDVAQMKAATLVTDTFLDEDHGAVPGLWPKADQSSTEECQRDEDEMSDGCWDHHAQRLAEGNHSTHWSHHLLAMLRKHREATGAVKHSAQRETSHDEL